MRFCGSRSSTVFTRQWVYPAGFFSRVKVTKFWSRSWVGWGFVYATALLFFFVYRAAVLVDMIKMHAGEHKCTFSLEASALTIGLLEDLVCATYLVTTLWVIDYTLTLGLGSSLCSADNDVPVAQVKWRYLRVFRRGVTFLTSLLLFATMAAPAAADWLLVRISRTRFTYSSISTIEITSSDRAEMHKTIVIVLVVSVFFAAVRALAPWADLMLWHPTSALRSIGFGRRHKHSRQGDSRNDSMNRDSKTTKTGSDKLETHLGCDGSPKVTHTTRPQPVDGTTTIAAARTSAEYERTKRSPWAGQSKRCGHSQCTLELAFIVIILIVVPAIVLAIAQSVDPLVSYVGWNATLTSLFAPSKGNSAVNTSTSNTSSSTPPSPTTPSSTTPSPSTLSSSLYDNSAESFIHSATENYTLFSRQSVYRRTTGFHGDLAFNVSVEADDPPNVLILAVESFRQRDSRYLVGEEDPSNLFKGWNGTVTPEFDRWAKRGVALPNLWSSWQTSRSVESLLFAQIPYNSHSSAMGVHPTDVELTGAPQLFQKKGYKTHFSTGCMLNYDNWDIFPQAHGFEEVWGRIEYRKLAESDLGILPSDWSGSAHRASGWGVHDDLSFELLGDLLVNETAKQRSRMANGEPKKPLFITHYTISSHHPFTERPAWYAKSEKPDFSALYEGEQNAAYIKNYLEMRHFTDMQLGEFLDTMSDAGVLNDTIVVIVGDHGLAAEGGANGAGNQEVAITHVAGALIAEGRLGDAVGLRIEDATEQYDILNTLADITGVPEEGFLQHGVGRSLKRSVPFGERAVFSNNPRNVKAVVRGHERLRYDPISASANASSFFLHDAYRDYDLNHDLFSTLDAELQEEWLTWRSNGRLITDYYKARWDSNCLVVADCPDVSL